MCSTNKHNKKPSKLYKKLPSFNIKNVKIIIKCVQFKFLLSFFVIYNLIMLPYNHCSIIRQFYMYLIIYYPGEGLTNNMVSRN